MNIRKQGFLFHVLLIIAGCTAFVILAQLAGMFLSHHGMFSDHNQHVNSFSRLMDGRGQRMPMGMNRHLVGAIGFSVIALILNLAIITIGLWLWRTSERRGVAAKWIGITLVLIGLWRLLPLIVAVPVILLLGYLIYKASKYGAKRTQPQLSSYEHTIHSNVDLLDQWERTVNNPSQKK
jgi:hypothetical protein